MPGKAKSKSSVRNSSLGSPAAMTVPYSHSACPLTHMSSRFNFKKHAKLSESGTAFHLLMTQQRLNPRRLERTKTVIKNTLANTSVQPCKSDRNVTSSLRAPAPV
jgi:hypothetical protein